ncbi:hypothetical protein ACFLXB_09030 [Chloroflexota bacterium]
MANQFSTKKDFRRVFKQVRIHRGLTWGLIILGALIAFEVFNFSTTEFALKDLLGDLNFAGFRWSSILAVAFCGIDFAGIARLFTPEKGKDEPAEVWYLFAAWLLAATMNATLTWWGVSVAITENATLAASQVVSPATLTGIVPVFVAVMVWLIRVLIIGTFSVSGNRLFSQSEEKAGFRPLAMGFGGSGSPSLHGRQGVHSVVSPQRASANSVRNNRNYSRREPGVQNLSMNASSERGEQFTRIRQ